CLQDIRVPLTF
nr:immunoglobulin light chain junction region [Macaca mulatta]